MKVVLVLEQNNLSGAHALLQLPLNLLSPLFYKIYSKEFSGHAVPINCPLCLSGNFYRFILMMIQKLLFSMTFTLLSQTHLSQALSSTGHNRTVLISAHLLPPQSAEHPSRGLCWPHWPCSQPLYYSLICLSMKCWSAQDPDQGTRSFRVHLYTLAT